MWSHLCTWTCHTLLLYRNLWDFQFNEEVHNRMQSPCRAHHPPQLEVCRSGWTTLSGPRVFFFALSFVYHFVTFLNYLHFFLKLYGIRWWEGKRTRGRPRKFYRLNNRIRYGSARDEWPQNAGTQKVNYLINSTEKKEIQIGCRIFVSYLHKTLSDINT